ncbi:adenylate/guanylate cyclase domain-containing protein [Leptospira wolffii]|uniref:adenylate/guanylate cyclase domain-containing protein n=1 Tax=Leptospira wolffii TaxID=409998 RepID=UPI00108492D0|nr:adenylate/guanylate cyclase domain-containing protein [Leptospira wolffii]TGK55995.1 adenylate/guanylate cyclase domain-containing protein [Leptospira wolffii]TGK72041.1 adenylate/guanylate cyclase domain-containing protein [Leptospira wolffii]TGK73706.1 adenylate/guanylate cyclase domain-containing protein [Leptospira wolffii]TGL27618.1 adenylate/guanylate cyclase domain-containing protein [Leptospira wolffii]
MKLRSFDTLANTLEKEILQSEKIRSKILLGIFAFAGVLWTGLFFLAEKEFDLSTGMDFPFEILIATVFAGAFYEALFLLLLIRLQKRGAKLPLLPRYGNTLIETSLPGIVLLILVQLHPHPVIPINSPVSNLFLIFVILSVLRMEFGLSVFTGVVAGIEFILIGFKFMPEIPQGSDEAYTFFFAKLQMWIRAALFFGSGIVAGLVSMRMKTVLKNSIRNLEERNEVVGMFGQYVSPSVVDKLMSQKSETVSESKNVCVMFLDIRNFTKFSESKSPTEVIEYLNTLFEDMIEIVNQNNGIINKFLGDGFMAVFGAPLSDEGRDVQNAVKASLEIQRKVGELNRSGKIPETKIGIGLHSGEAMTGNVGSSQRKEYTIIGDTVNLASRVEQLNKDFGSEILLTDSVFEEVKHTIEAESLPPVKVKGREKEVFIYRLV